MGETGGGNCTASCVGVREPEGDAVGGGSDNDRRCKAESDGEGLISFGSRNT